MSTHIFLIHIGIPPLVCSQAHEEESESENEDNDDNEEDGWMELESNDTTTICLFCSKQFPDTLIGYTHLKDDHAFDLSAMKAKFKMDQYSFIKVNKLLYFVYYYDSF